MSVGINLTSNSVPILLRFNWASWNCNVISCTEFEKKLAFSSFLTVPCGCQDLNSKHRVLTAELPGDLQNWGISLKSVFFLAYLFFFSPLSGTTVTCKLSLLMLHKFLRFSSLFFRSPPSTPHSLDWMLPIEFAYSFIFSTIFNSLLGPFS